MKIAKFRGGHDIAHLDVQPHHVPQDRNQHEMELHDYRQAPSGQYKGQVAIQLHMAILYVA